MEIIKHTAGHYTIAGWDVTKGISYWYATSPQGVTIRNTHLALLKRQIREAVNG